MPVWPGVLGDSEAEDMNRTGWVDGSLDGWDFCGQRGGQGTVWAGRKSIKSLRQRWTSYTQETERRPMWSKWTIHLIEGKQVRESKVDSRILFWERSQIEEFGFLLERGIFGMTWAKMIEEGLPKILSSKKARRRLGCVWGKWPESTFQNTWN